MKIFRDEEIIKEAEPKSGLDEEIYKPAEYEDEILSAADIEKINGLKEKEKPKEEFEIEINKPAPESADAEKDEDIKGGTVTSDVYYRFENKFFEEVKILEKLFSYTEKECKDKNIAKLSDRTLQRFTEIIEISSELSNLARQLQLDLISDIFLSINLLFTKSIKKPSLISADRVRLLNSSLSLVTSLIKGDDYLGYDDTVNKIVELKDVLTKPQEAPVKVSPQQEEETLKKESLQTEPPKLESLQTEPPKSESIQTEPQQSESIQTESPKSEPPQEEIPQAELRKEEINQDVKEIVVEIVPPKPGEEKAAETVKGETFKETDDKTEIIKAEAPDDTSLFKMKYLIKEFEKNFLNLSSIEGEYSKFEILEDVDTLNSLLRMLAKVSASVKNDDVLKLSEVSYVFLKYLKDYKMDLLDAEIQQIIKYIIFTYKMLLTGRKPEDFEVLVQYLNNPVKIFTDS